MTAGSANPIFPSMGTAVPHSAERVHWLKLGGGALLLLWTLFLAARRQPWIFLDWVNLAFHEAGHLFLLPFGETLHFLGGTLFQLAIPAGVGLHLLLRKESPFGAALCGWWFGQNFLGISVYMADARELKLPLVGGGENDWNHLFYQWGLLGEDSVRRIAGTTHAAGVIFMLAGCLAALLLALPPATRRSLAEILSSRPDPGRSRTAAG